MIFPMKKIFNRLTWMLAIVLLVLSCKEEDPTLGVAPTVDDAVFTFAPTAENDNIINFTNDSDAFLKTWDFGNGTKAKGNNVVGTFPVKGSYNVTLTVYNAGGSASYTTTVEIAETDPTLLDIPVYNMLTGGASKPEGKTWIIDYARAGHFGVGPNPSSGQGDTPEWYAAGVNEKDGGGLYNDKYTFKLADFEFVMETEGDIYLNGKQQSVFPGSYESPVGDYTAPYNSPGNLTWSVSEDDDGNQFVTISPGGFIGYYTGVSTYKIVSLEENEMFLRYEDAADPGLAWYLRLIPDGFTPPEPEPTTTSLPISFETTAKPPFVGFGGSTYEVASNPSVGGINNTAKVGKTVKGTETWAGIVTDLDSKLDFSVNNTFKLKVYSPVAGVAKLKIEVQGSPSTNKEVDANITQVNQWQELTFDFSGTASDTYNKLALFFDFGQTAQNTFYFDDVTLEAAGCADADTESTDPAMGLNFTMANEVFGQFGNIVSAKVTNPFQSGINTSCFVNKYEKSGGCETWSGVAYSLGTAIDFSNIATKRKFKMKVYAVNQVTNVTLRLERLPYPNADPAADRVATITATGEWQELTFDFSDITDPNTYKNIIVYFDRDAPCDNDVYYFDDLIQVE
jgi:PKD repeat protein